MAFSSAAHAWSSMSAENDVPPRCAFEIAPNEPPYWGVRGRATASLEPEGASALLRRLLDRYLGSADSSLGQFLLARAEEELVVRLRPSRIASWDYSGRMQDALKH